MFIGNDQLKQELERSLDADHMTEEFAAMACIIAKGHLNQRYPAHGNMHDFLSAFHEAIVRNWKKIKPHGNIHSYICTIAGSRAKNVIRSHVRYSRRVEFLYRDNPHGVNITYEET